MTVPKETLMAYADGELDDEERATVEAAMILDPEIAHEVERQQALRRQLETAFAGVLSEPAPERLIAAARTAPAVSIPQLRAIPPQPAMPLQPAGSAGDSTVNVPDPRNAKTNVVNVAHARTERSGQMRRRWSLPEWTAMAACLSVGLFLGHLLLRPPAAPFAVENGGLVATGSLAAALSNQLAGESPEDNVAQVVLSFRDRAGRYCRTFALREDNALAGLACHDDDRWQVEVMARGTGETGGEAIYRMAAGTLPPSVLQAVQERISGEPLDATGEAAARNKRWR